MREYFKNRRIPVRSYTTTHFIIAQIPLHVNGFDTTMKKSRLGERIAYCPHSVKKKKKDPSEDASRLFCIFAIERREFL